MAKQDLLNLKKAPDKLPVRRLLLGLTIVLLVLAVAQAGVATYADLQTPKAVAYQDPSLLPLGTMAPDFTLTGIDGKPYTLSQYRGKKYVLVEFFSTRCPHCQRSTTYLEALYGNKKDNFEILSISAGDPPNAPSTAAQFQKDYKVTYPILDHPPAALTDAYHIQGFPTLYLIDKNGTIVWDYISEMNFVLLSSLNAMIQQ